jgi:hypothetical protein
MDSFIKQVFSAWDVLSPALTQHGFVSSTKQDQNVGKAVIEIEGALALALVEIWEHGPHLDVTIFYLPSKQSIPLSAGLCESLSVAIARLNSLHDALLKHAAA